MKSSLCSVLLVSFILSVNLIVAQSNAAPCSDLKSPGDIDVQLAQLGSISNDNKAEWEVLLRERFEYIDCLLANKELEKAEFYLENAEEILLQVSSILPSIQLLYYTYLGRLRELNNSNEEALDLYQRAESIIDRNDIRISNKDKSLIYKYIGTAYINKSDYSQGLKFFELGLNALGEEQKYQEGRIALLKLIGTTVCRTIKWADTSKYFEEAMRLANKLPSLEQRMENITKIKLDFALALREIEEYDQAVQKVREAINLAQQIYSKSPEEMRNVYEKAIQVTMIANKNDLTINYLIKYINISNKLASKDRIDLADKYTWLARSYMKKEEFKLAKKYLKKSENGYKVDINRKTPLEGTDVPRDHYLHNYLLTKNLTHLRTYEKTMNISELREVIPYNQLAVSILETMFNEVESYVSKAYIIDRYHAYFEISIWTHYYLYAETDSLKYLDQAYNFAERSKAMLLKASISQAGAEQLFELPEDLSERWKGLKEKLVELENELYEREQSEEEGTVAIKEKIARTNRAAYLLEDSLQQMYPDYFKLHYVPEPLTTAEIQRELLEQDQAIVHYFVGRFRMYIFTFTKDDATMTEVVVPPSMAGDVMALRESIYAGPFEQSDSLLGAYRERAYSLYQLMFKPIADQLPKKVLIIPDDILEYLPFEALLYDTVADASTAISDYPFLINKHQFSYTHSLQLTVEMSRLKLKPDKRKVLAYAPAFKGEEEETDMATRQRDLGPIVNNVREVEAIASLFSTDTRIGREATLERFLEEAEYYSVIHLATHAKANDQKGEYSYLAFTEIPDTIQNELLYASGLYTQPLNADMVVLSACEGGIGQMRHGEGAITLARAFAHAGVKSTVTSLWRVDDASAADLMTGFYRELKEEKPKDEALRGAKMAFIHENGGARAHPFYWAAFVASGNMEPLDLSGGGAGSWVWWLLGIGVLVLVVLRGRRS